MKEETHILNTNEQLAEYAALLTEKYAEGRLEEAKYERLMDKLDEWSTYEQRKEE